MSRRSVCEHDREIEWSPRRSPRQRVPYFRVYCTKCDARSGEYRLPGHRVDDQGYPVDLEQACDDVLDHAR